MNSVDIIKKHLSPEVPFKLKNEDGSEDIIMLKPLTIGEQALCMSISKKLEKIKDGDIESSSIKEVADLFSSIIKRSIPEIDDLTLENFVLTNFVDLSAIIEQLIPKNKHSEKLDLIKQKIAINK